jgi:hypothetical protein
MLKRLAILGLLVFWVCGARSQVPGNGSGQHNKAQDKQETTDPSKPIVAIESPAGANNQDHASEKPAEYPWGELLAPANIPNWFLVVVGGVTGWFVYKTLRAIKKQADIMETQAKDARESGAQATRIALATAQAARKAADAADISAKAAMGVAIPTLAIYKFSFVNTGRENPAVFYRYPRIRLELKNYGQSPAFLRKFSICLSWGDEKTGKSPSYPFDEEQVVDAGDTYAFSESDLEVLDNPSPEAIQDLVAGKTHLTFAGWVSYKDMFGSPTRRLTFCKGLLEYDPDPAKMLVMDPTPLNPVPDYDEDWG